MNTLAERIEHNLQERDFCVVFENELERCWPSEKIEPEEREKQIQGFAQWHGWTVSILHTDSDLSRAIFTPG